MYRYILILLCGISLIVFWTFGIVLNILDPRPQTFVTNETPEWANPQFIIIMSISFFMILIGAIGLSSQKRKTQKKTINKFSKAQNKR